MEDQERNELTARLLRVQRLRRIVVVIALGLLIAALLHPMTLLAYTRSALWVLAGVMCLVEANLAKRLGVTGARLINAIIYFAVAVLPLVRGR